MDKRIKDATLCKRCADALAERNVMRDLKTTYGYCSVCGEKKVVTHYLYTTKGKYLQMGE